MINGTNNIKMHNKMSLKERQKLHNVFLNLRQISTSQELQQLMTNFKKVFLKQI
jgi:hypothetical protein